MPKIGELPNASAFTQTYVVGYNPFAGLAVKVRVGNLPSGKIIKTDINENGTQSGNVGLGSAVFGYGNFLGGTTNTMVLGKGNTLNPNTNNAFVTGRGAFINGNSNDVVINGIMNYVVDSFDSVIDCRNGYINASPGSIAQGYNVSHITSNSTSSFGNGLFTSFSNNSSIFGVFSSNENGEYTASAGTFNNAGFSPRSAILGSFLTLGDSYIGYGSDRSVLVGTDHFVSNSGKNIGRNIAIGSNNTIDESYCTIIGHISAAGADGAIVIGNNATANGTNAVQIGTGMNSTPDTLQFQTNTIANSNGVQVTTGAGAPVAAAADGTLYVDTTNNLLYFRSSGAWVQA